MLLTHFTGVGLFHQSGIVPLSPNLHNSESWTSKKRLLCCIDSVSLPSHSSVGVLLKPCSWAFSASHWTCCAAMCYTMGKPNGPWYLRPQLIFLQRLLLGRAKQCVLCVPEQGLLLLEASICIFLNPKLWAFCTQKTGKMWPQQVEERPSPGTCTYNPPCIWINFQKVSVWVTLKVPARMLPQFSLISRPVSD